MKTTAQEPGAQRLDPGSLERRILPEAEVRVVRNGKRIILTIRDNGLGFNPAIRPSKAAGKSGFGLTGMVHIDRYDFHHSQASSQQPVEAVIERFEFTPLPNAGASAPQAH